MITAGFFFPIFLACNHRVLLQFNEDMLDVAVSFSFSCGSSVLENCNFRSNSIIMLSQTISKFQ